MPKPTAEELESAARHVVAIALNKIEHGDIRDGDLSRFLANQAEEQFDVGEYDDAAAYLMAAIVVRRKESNADG